MAFLITKLSHLKHLATCIILLLQVVVFDQAVAHEVSSDSSELDRTATLKLLHQQGKANYLEIDTELGIVLLPVRINEVESWAILDNKAASTIVNTAMADEYGFKHLSQSRSIRTTFAEMESRVALDVDLEFPGQFKITGNIDAADLSQLSSAIGKRSDNKVIGALLGNDILKNISFLLDAKNNRIVFAKRGAINAKGKGNVVIPLDSGAIPSRVGGKIAALGLDLGTTTDLSIFESSWSRFFGDAELTPLSHTMDGARSCADSFRASLDSGRCWAAFHSHKCQKGSITELES